MADEIKEKNKVEAPPIQASPESLKEAIDSEAEPLIKEEYLTRFIMGDITAADMMGLTRDDLYSIARRGYELMQQGKLNDAKQVFDGLVYLDPYDPYFYTVLGAICQQQEDLDGALSCYENALRLQPWNVNALANRGEILFKKGNLVDAFNNLQKVIELDPDFKNRSTFRAKAIILALKEVLDKEKEA